MITDILGGHLDNMFVDPPPARRGSPLGIAVTIAERSAVLPDLPSMKEAGVPELDLTPWNGPFGPAGMRKDLAMKINAAMRKILAEPELKKRLASIGFDAFTSSPEELDAFVRSQLFSGSATMPEEHS